jgi:hypothetical protein
MKLCTKVNARWEWLLTTITDLSPTELIAVENRSRNTFKLISASSKVLSLNKTGRPKNKFGGFSG